MKNINPSSKIELHFKNNLGKQVCKLVMMMIYLLHEQENIKTVKLIIKNQTRLYQSTACRRKGIPGHLIFPTLIYKSMQGITRQVKSAKQG